MPCSPSLFPPILSQNYFPLTVLDFRSLMQRQTSVIFNLGGLSEEDKKLLGFLLTVQKEQPDTRDFLSQLFTPQETTAFSEVERGEQARRQYENLERSEAMISLHGQTQLIRFPTLPKVDVPLTIIERVKQEYTKRLLTP